MLINTFMGRTLDKIFEAGPRRVFGAAALRAALREDVEFGLNSCRKWSSRVNLMPERLLRESEARIATPFT